MLTKFIYSIDTTTNVCPSEHVIGAFGVVFAARDTKRFSSAKWTVFIVAQAVLISLSILFVKQHSAVDVLAAVPVCFAGWLFCFRRGRKSGQKHERL
jgi:membrane-associated phospholipid phosphatase